MFFFKFFNGELGGVVTCDLLPNAKKELEGMSLVHRYICLSIYLSIYLSFYLSVQKFFFDLAVIVMSKCKHHNYLQNLPVIFTGLAGVYRNQQCRDVVMLK